MPSSRIVVMGASAGGIEAVSAAISGLPGGFEAAVLVVIHTGNGENRLAGVLRRTSPLPVETARDGERLRAGRVYVAVSDRHLLVQDGAMRVVNGPRQHGFRPAIDALFISAAGTRGRLVAGVVLSGALSDGIAGLRAIKHAGGRAIVQNPEEAAFPSMPPAALRDVEVDVVLPAAEIGGELARWAADAEPQPDEHSRGARPEWRAAQRNGPNGGSRGRRSPAEARDTGGGHDPGAPHHLVPISCPSCGGALSETSELGSPQYECHVGHRFNPDSLAFVLDNQVEGVLWSAVRALQEKALLRRRMHAGTRSPALVRLREEWLREAQQAERQADRIRGLIDSVPPPTMQVEATELERPARRDRSRKAAAKPARRAGRTPARRKQARNSGD